MKRKVIEKTKLKALYDEYNELWMIVRLRDNGDWVQRRPFVFYRSREDAEGFVQQLINQNPDIYELGE